MALGLYGYPNGQRRYLACTNPHTLLSTGRLHSERHAFNNLQHMLLYWAYELFQLAFAASLDAIDARAGEFATGGRLKSPLEAD